MIVNEHIYLRGPSTSKEAERHPWMSDLTQCQFCRRDSELVTLEYVSLQWLFWKIFHNGYILLSQSSETFTLCKCHLWHQCLFSYPEAKYQCKTISQLIGSRNCDVSQEPIFNWWSHTWVVFFPWLNKPWGVTQGVHVTALNSGLFWHQCDHSASRPSITCLLTIRLAAGPLIDCLPPNNTTVPLSATHT